jgi:hypothetical protein
MDFLESAHAIGSGGSYIPLGPFNFKFRHHLKGF